MTAGTLSELKRGIQINLSITCRVKYFVRILIHEGTNGQIIP